MHECRKTKLGAGEWEGAREASMPRLGHFAGGIRLAQYARVRVRRHRHATARNRRVKERATRRGVQIERGHARDQLPPQIGATVGVENRAHAEAARIVHFDKVRRRQRAHGGDEVVHLKGAYQERRRHAACSKRIRKQVRMKQGVSPNAKSGMMG